MKRYASLALLFCMACITGIAQDAVKNAVGEDAISDESPVVESILYNNDVQKRETGGKRIQATGFREGKEKHFVIHFQNKKLHGEWQSYFDNNQPCDSGSFVQNLPDGEWKTWHKNGQLKSIRNYSAKKFQYIRADMQRNHPKDQRYQITRYAKTDLNIKRHFLPAFKSDQIGSQLPLLEKITWNTSGNGAEYIAPFKQCLHHGAFINFFENGLVKDSGYYHNGLKHELWTESSGNGDLRAVGFYHHGRKQGQWKYYNNTGELTYTEIYKHGQKTGVHHFKD